MRSTTAGLWLATLVAALLLALTVAANAATCANRLAYAQVPSGFCPFVWADGLKGPRGMARAANNDLLVVEQDAEQITVLWDDNKNGVSDQTERAVLAKARGLNHAVVIHGAFLYATNASTVMRWPYTAGRRSSLGSPEMVVRNIPANGGHVSRTVVFDAKERLYVQVGSGSNVDSNSIRARVVRFEMSALPRGGFTWDQGELFADGLRNEVGLRFDAKGRLWGVENGIDNVYRESLGGDIHNTNPSEEVNLFDTETPGLFYGYPYCWSQYNLTTTGTPPGTQWATNQFLNDGIHSDAWCQNPKNVQKPKFNLPAHYAPLDILFYYPSNASRFPAAYGGSAFVSSHGSWNRQPPVGYRVLRLVVDAQGMPTSFEPFLAYQGPGDTGSNWPHRPVGLEVGSCATFGECLFVSSDASNKILAVGYSG